MLTLLVVLVVLVLLMRGQGYLAWVLGAGCGLLAWLGARTPDGLVPAPVPLALCTLLWAGLAVLFGYRPWRRRILSGRVMARVGPLLPKVSDTERVALEAGTVWWDGRLFSGDPHWPTLLDFDVAALPEREQAFVDGPVEDLCAMIDDEDVVQRGDLPPEAWDALKRERFFGMIIPEEYGGLGFSAQGHSAVVTKLASRSVTAAVSVMVPNSLGPAELLLHYGTPEQRERWLPRLARGEEIPCFALTGPENGSDAAAMEARGVVTRGTWQGEEVVGIRLDWEKRYTTLGPIATVIGLAFRLHDPEHLIGDVDDLGITCALVPADLPGIRIGERHDPLGVPFHNGPNWGEGVFVRLDALIGGPEMAGQGWRMLMDCLAAGRSISLPSLSSGCSQVCARYTGAYASVRRQFGLPVGRFEGVAEALGRIGGHNYWMNAVRRLTAAAVDAGEKPSVLSAVAKAWCTEGMRAVVTDAMDVAAGAGISRGPSNVVGRAHQAAPIGITVEGANILTRTMIVFGQGAIRCHPFVQDELAAVEDGDVVRFDRAFFGHLELALCNMVRAFVRSFVNVPVLVLGRGRARSAAEAPVLAPAVAERAERRSRRSPSWFARRRLARVSRASARFAALADVVMILLGGGLKRKEAITGRMADALAWMYVASAALKRSVDEGERATDRPFVQWSVDHALAQVDGALAGVLDNLRNRPVAWMMRLVLYPLGARPRPPKDRVGRKVAQGLLFDGEARCGHTADVFVPPPDEPGLGRLETALAKALAARPIEKRLRDAARDGRLDDGEGTPADRAVRLGILRPEEAHVVQEADLWRRRVVAVDSFDPTSFLERRG